VRIDNPETLAKHEQALAANVYAGVRAEEIAGLAAEIAKANRG